MASRLYGPTNFREAVSFIEKVSKGYYRSNGWSDSDLSTTVKFLGKGDFEDLDTCASEDPKIPYDLMGVSDSVKDCLRGEDLSSDFAATIKIYDNKDLQTVTAVFDKSRLDDIISGQTFKPILKEFFIVGKKYSNDFYFDEFMAYVEKMVVQANANLADRYNIHKLLGQIEPL